MVVLSSRTLAMVVVMVVVVSLAGSMVGYALGATHQRTEIAKAGDVPPVAEPITEAEPTDVPSVTTQNEGTVLPKHLAETNGLTDDLEVGQAASRNGVTLTLSDAGVNKWERGLELHFSLANRSGKSLAFLFVPERAVAVEDSRGAHFNLRWAEYDGEIQVPNGQEIRLVHALFEGEVQHPGVEHATVIVRDVPGLGDASWRVPLSQSPAPSTAADPRFEE